MICRLYIGLLTKEKVSGAHKATTFFSKVPADPKWDAAKLTNFSNRLSKYDVSVKSYRASFETDASAYKTETETDEDDNSMDLLPCGENIAIPSAPSTLPPQVAIQTSASSNTNRGFLTPPSPRRIHSLQRKQSMPTDFFSTANIATPQKHAYSLSSQAKKKNRIKPMEQPPSPFTSPHRDIPASQEYPYQNI